MVAVVNDVQRSVGLDDADVERQARNEFCVALGR